MRKLSVLMPVFNEARTLRTIVQRVLESPVGLDIELVCVDDQSTDDSFVILEELASNDARVRVFRQTTNAGKGAAIRKAIQEMSGDLAIIQDADLEYDPDDYPRVIAPILDGKADAVFGSRFAASEVRGVLSFWHSTGNRILTSFSNMANDLNLTDMETCYKAVRADVLKRLRLTSDRFGLEPEITARLAQWGARIYEVPISYHGRSYDEGKNIGWRDGFEALALILKFRFWDTRATDQSSVVTRQSLGKAPRFRKWILDSFGSDVEGSILEANAGPGHTTTRLLRNERLVVTDSDEVHVESLRRRFGHLENVSVADWHSAIDMCRNEPVDSVLLLDGLQRAPEPKELLSLLAQCARSDGRILIQVPAHPELYGPADEALGHLRRFTYEDVREIVGASGLELVSIKPFNKLGAWGWRARQALGGSDVTRLVAKTFDLLVPLAKALDRIGIQRGLSWIVIARVP